MRGFNKDVLVREGLERLGNENGERLSATLQFIQSLFPNADVYKSRMTEQGCSKLTIGVKAVGSTKGSHRVFVISPSIEKFSPHVELFLTVASGSKKRSALVGRITGMGRYEKETNKGIAYNIPLCEQEGVARILGRMAPIALFKDHLKGNGQTPDDYHDAETEVEQREIARISGNASLSVTERAALIKARIGQGFFRDQLMARWQGKCAVTFCTQRSMLRASHIRPWADHKDGRLDTNNGILLSVTYDALFDQHLITFADDGRMLLSNRLEEETIKALHIRTDAKITLAPGQRAYLKHHRKTFEKAEANIS